MVKNVFVIIILIISMSSCEDKDAFLNAKGEVEILLSTSDYEDLANTKTNTLDVDEFKVELINSKGVIFKRSLFSEIVGTEIPMNLGNYKVRAYHGDSTQVGFDVVFFLGEKDFTVVGQTGTDVSVVCKQGNVKVAINYGEDLKANYTSYRTTVQSGEPKDTLMFSKDETRAGFVPAGDLIFRLHVVDPFTGKNMVYKSAPYKGAPADFITFNVDTEPAVQTEVSLSITIDDTTIDHNIAVELPSGLLPKDPPSAVVEGFDATNSTFSTVEGVKASALAVNINSEAGIESCTMMVNSPSLIGLGWPAEIDFLNLTPELEILLKETGLKWTEGMTGLNLAKIDFSLLSEVIEYTDDASKNNVFTVAVADEFRQTYTGTFTLLVEQSQISVNDVVSADVWTKSASVVLNVAAGNVEYVFPEISVDGVGWIKPAYTNVVSGNHVVTTITGLNPNKNYFVRAGYNNNVTTGKEFTTETEHQIPNSGFEEWSLDTVEHKPFIAKFRREIYFPFANRNSKCWDSNNWETMNKMSTTSEQNYKFFPTTAHTAGRNGGRAAQVVSIAYNGTKVIKGNETPGKLFIGTYIRDEYGVAGISPTGTPLASRPTKMGFYYQYNPLSTDEFSVAVEVRSGSVVIGSGTFKKSTSTHISSWTKGDVAINYSNNTLKATTVYVLFMTTTKSKDFCTKRWVELPKDSAEAWSGSCLKLDDISLVYEK